MQIDRKTEVYNHGIRKIYVRPSPVFRWKIAHLIAIFSSLKIRMLCSGLLKAAFYPVENGYLHC